jgi:putative FmdB family regulatory protein
VEAAVPTYDYVCSKCRHRFEEVQPFSAEPVAPCPNCGGKSSRQFTVPVVVYKGSGFYTTDHGRSSNGRNGSAKKEEAKDTGAADKPAGDKKEPAKSSPSTASSRDD